jgi:O-antigen/teichoic acid export membrane protein
MWILLAEALFIPTGLLTAAFLTRRLGPHGYGLFTLAVTLVSSAEWCVPSLFSRATIKLISEAQDWRPIGATILRLYLIAGGSVALLLYLLVIPCATLLHEPDLASALRLFVFDVPLFCLAQAHRSILIGIGGFRQKALASAGRWIARPCLIVLLVELGFSITGAILGSMGALLVELAISRSYVRPRLLYATHVPTRQLWHYSVPLFLSALSVTCCNRLDLFALKVLGGTTAQVGIYGAAQNLSLLAHLFAWSVTPSLLATLSRLLHTGELSLAREVGRNAMRGVLLLLPIAGIVTGAASEIVGLTFGPLFLSAVPLLSLLIFAAWASVMSSVALAILTAAGKPGLTFTLTGPLVFVAAAGHYLLIPWLGAIGAAMVTAGCMSLGAGASLLTVYYLWSILPSLGTLWRSMLVSGGAYALAAFWPTPGLLLLVKLPVIGCLGVLVFLVLGEFDAKEISLARSVLGRSTTTKRAPNEA